MSCLRKLPTDGTFDQIRPALRLKGSWFASLDLKSARFPVLFTFNMVEALFSESIAMLYIQLVLCSSRFRFKIGKREGVISFAVGQPLGFLFVFLASPQLFDSSNHYQ